MEPKLCCVLNFYVGCDACGLQTCTECHSSVWVNHMGPDLSDICPTQYHYVCPTTKKRCHRDRGSWHLTICDKE